MNCATCDLDFFAARFYLYKLFNVVLATKPSQEVLEVVVGPDTQEAIRVLAEAGYRLDDLEQVIGTMRNQEAAELKHMDVIRAAYSQLFLVPSEQSVKLYESVYTQQMNTLFGPTTVDMRRYLREAGLESSAEGNFPEDYLPLMLDFMATLAQRTYSQMAVEESDTIEAGVSQDADSSQAAQMEPESELSFQLAFENDHLGSWLQKMLDDLDTKDESRFYFNLVKALISFIKADKCWLETSVAKA